MIPLRSNVALVKTSIYWSVIQLVGPDFEELATATVIFVMAIKKSRFIHLLVISGYLDFRWDYIYIYIHTFYFLGLLWLISVLITGMTRAIAAANDLYHLPPTA